MLGIPTLDLIVIATYSVVVVAIGLRAMVRVHTQEDFFLGGRRFGKLFQVFSAFGQATSSESAVGTVTTTYRDGAGGTWSHLILLWATPIYWFAAPWYRRMRVLTLGDFFHQRYQSRPMAVFYSVLASFMMVISIGLGLKAACVTLRGITLKPESALTAAERAEHAQAARLESLVRLNAQNGLNEAEIEELQFLQQQQPRREFSHLGEDWLVWAMVGVVVIYGIAGGLRAVVWADTVQGVLILVLSVILIPFGVAKLNALHGGSGLTGAGQALHAELPGRFFSLLGSAQNLEFTWYFVIVLSLMATLNVAVMPNTLTANASARDELAARVGFMTGMFIKRFCTVLWGAVGLLAYALYSHQVQNPDLVWGHATRDLLGGLGLGLVGLVIACLFSALHSSVSMMTISAASLFTRNVYAPLFPDRSEAHYVRVGRVAGFLVLLAGALVCLEYDTVLDMLKFYWEYNAILAAAFWCGLKWRRATRQGAWAAMVTAFILYLALPLGLPLAFPSLRTGERFLAQTRERRAATTFRATRYDVEERRQEIEHWRGKGTPPPSLRVGQRAVRIAYVAPKAIYWAQGIRESDGVKRGEGLFYPELYLLGQVVDLTANPRALNETLRYAYKMLLPFAVLILVSLLTRPDDSAALQRLFLRMRTPVRADRKADEAALQAAYAHPASTHARLLLPRTQLEFFKWDRQDTLGFLLGCVAALAIVALLYLILNLGR
jgi:solute:Na+ symporter, SSS family